MIVGPEDNSGHVGWSLVACSRRQLNYNKTFFFERYKRGELSVEIIQYFFYTRQFNFHEYY